MYKYKDFKKDNDGIKYEILSYTKNSGGKGEHYSLSVLYKEKVNKLSITSNEYENIINGIFPKVYFYKETLITDWSYEQRKRYIYVFLFLVVFTNIVFYFNSKKFHKS
ncbi:MAG TPA: hypothetical protein VLY87_02280 [Flavobacterium sp.]|nr:hypothetical protein [Flavobacterium sp.]